MSAPDFALLAPHLTPVSLPKGAVLVRSDHVFDSVYFPESGIVSIIAEYPGGHKAEAGLLGCDGFGPSSAVMGCDRQSEELCVQVASHGFLLPRAVLVAVLQDSATLRDHLLRYVHVLVVQIAHTLLAHAVHFVDQRLARWILMVHDRSASDDLALTHEFIATVLAIRRPSVTTSLHVLEGHHFIRNERRLIVVRNRFELEAFAGESYGKPEAEYRRLIGPMT